MSIEVQTILNQNITVVFDSLDLHDINSSVLKSLMGREIRATVMDTPEMVVAVYPPAPTIIQIGDRRIRVNLPQDTRELGQVPLWDLARASAALVPSESAPVAYGFNYDVGVVINHVDANELLIQQFIHSPEELNQKLGGSLISTIPRFRFQRDEIRYDLVLEPTDKDHLKIHLNVHYELSGQSLPDSDILRRAYRKEYERLVEMLPVLISS